MSSADKLPIGEPLWTPEDTIATEVGTVEQVTEELDRPVCVLWGPDIEQRHGWREYYVKKTTPKPGARKMGYKKQ
jgi:hypothetical protein